MLRLPRRSCALTGAAAALMLVCGCAGSTTTPQPEVTPAATASVPASPSPATPSRSVSTVRPSASPAADVVVEVRIANGKVEPNVQTVKVRAGQKVMITMISDVADSIHVHGYDKTLEVKPNKPGSLTFTADVKGVFEIETHETAKLVAKLNVS